MLYKDYFSKQSVQYAKYRPAYPLELFLYLKSLTEKHELAWDCGTGNGQCAIQLSSYFEKVYASDPSEQQIQNAFHHEKIIYRVEKAEESSLENETVDLIVVAQALHWFDQNAFFNEAARVLKKKGVLAVISYLNPVVSKEIDAITTTLHDTILAGFWLPENNMVNHKYQSVAFPFQGIPTPEFKIVKELSAEDFKGHLSTWSAVQRFKDIHNYDPLDEIETALKNLWNPNELKKVCWNLHLIIGLRNNFKF